MSKSQRSVAFAKYFQWANDLVGRLNIRKLVRSVETIKVAARGGPGATEWDRWRAQ